MCHETSSHGTTASRRLLEEGDTPILVDCSHPCLPDEDGFFHPSFFQSGSFAESLTPSQSIVWFLLATWSVSADWWISMRDYFLLAPVYFTPSSCFKSFLCSFCLTSNHLPVSLMYTMGQCLHGIE